MAADPLLQIVIQPDLFFRKPGKAYRVHIPIQLQQLDQDVDAVCFAGFTEEELRQYRELEERIGNRILHHLQAETAKES